MTDTLRLVAAQLNFWVGDIEGNVEKIIAARRGWISDSHCRSPRRALDPHEDAMVDRFLAEVCALSQPAAAPV